MSPLSYLEREFVTIEDVWDEIEQIALVNAKSDRSIGQDLFHLVPLFTNPKYIMSSDDITVINEYNMIKNFNLSLGTLDDVSNQLLNCFTVIQNEYNEIAKFERLKDGKK